MKNINFHKISKVNEERYFKNDGEFYRFVLRSLHMTHDSFWEHCEKHSTFYDFTGKRLDSDGFILIGNFICLLSIGCYTRTSGTYKYNILSIQKDLLSLNEKKQLFK